MIDLNREFKRYGELFPPREGVFKADYVGMDELIDKAEDLVPLELAEFMENEAKILEILAVSLPRKKEIRTFTSGKFVIEKLLKAKQDGKLAGFKCHFVKKNSKKGKEYYDLE